MNTIARKIPLGIPAYPSMSVDRVITHSHSHADEILGIMALRHTFEGRKQFPGIAKASMGYMSTGTLPKDKDWKSFPGKIFIGCGGSPFDEHSLSRNLQEKYCAATLVGRQLEILRLPQWEKVMDFALREDNYKVNHPQTVSLLVKMMHQYLDTEEGAHTVYEWAETLYLSEIDAQHRFWNECLDMTVTYDGAVRRWNRSKEDWDHLTLDSACDLLCQQGKTEKADWAYDLCKCAESEQQRRFDACEKEYSQGERKCFAGDKGRQIRLIVVHSDNTEMSKFARSRGENIVVQMNDSGQVQIFTQDSSKLGRFDLTPVYDQIKKRGEEERWHLPPFKSILLNGSLTAEGVLPTEIPLEDIVQIVIDEMTKVW